MKPVVACCLLAGVMLLEVRAASSAPTAPPCTAIPVVLVDSLDTAKARTGDVFRFHTIDTIVVPGPLTLPAEAVGYGVVTFASAAGAHGKGGDMVVEARYIATSRGQFQVTIDSTGSSVVQGGSSGASGNVNANVAAVPLPFVGTAVGAFNYFHAGKNAVIKAGSRFVVIPVGDLSRGLRCAP